MKTILKRIAFSLSMVLMALPLIGHAQAHSRDIKNVVLVHGAFADGSSWNEVSLQLQKKGFNVIAVQNPLTSIADDVAATKRAIAMMDGPVLLVGHSYGGMVITEAGNDPKVLGLLYVSALIPDDNQSVMDVLQPFPPAPGSSEFQQDETGFLHLSRQGIHKYFAQDLPAAKRELIYATQVHWAAQATVTKISTAAWKSKPSWCIVATEDQMINPGLERATAKMIGATVLEIESSHIPMVSHPKKVADFIQSATKTLYLE